MTKGALNKIKIKPDPTKDGSDGDHYREALLELLTPTGLTMEKYRTELDQNLTRTRTRLNKLFLRHSPLPEIPPLKLTHSNRRAPQAIPTIEEGSEAEGEGSSANGHTLSYNDGGKNSLPQRILRRLIPSSVGRKDA